MLMGTDPVGLSGAKAVGLPGSTRLRGGLWRRARCGDAAGLIAIDLRGGWLMDDRLGI